MVPRMSSFGNYFNSLDYYNHRGKNGFDRVPYGTWEYMGGPVPNFKAYPKGILPRPHGPRDNAALAGFPYPPKKSASFGKIGLGRFPRTPQMMGWIENYDNPRNWGRALQKSSSSDELQFCGRYASSI